MKFLNHIYEKRTILLSVILLTILVVFLYSTSSDEVIIDGEYIGVVDNKSVVEDIIEDITNKASAQYGTEVIVGCQISYSRVFFRDKNKISYDVLRDQIENSVKLNAQAYGINVNGKDIAYLKDKKSAEEVLKQIKAPYIQNQGKTNVSFIEDVRIIEKEIPLSELRTSENALNEILMNNEEIEKKYIAQDGDTVSEIAEKYELDIEDIKKLNPDVSIDNISIGQELRLIAPRYIINVKAKVSKTFEEKIPFDVEYESTNALYKDESKIKLKGEEGVKLVNAELVYINGILDKTNILQEDVIKTPKSGVILKGTKERPRTITTGIFELPSRGILTSRFGKRWGRQHTGIDFGAPIGTDNKAADGGKVIFSGWRSGYGNLIIIDHQNGFTTYYAHNNTMNVKKGQKVEKGEVVGTVGTTGNVTGPNLHFEVRKNGVPIDPSKYIK